MKKTLHFTPQGVCSDSIDIVTEDGIVREILFQGGCSGNLQGIALLARGMNVQEVIDRLEGVRCGSKCTSCPDQLAKALRKLNEQLS